MDHEDHEMARGAEAVAHPDDQSTADLGSDGRCEPIAFDPEPPEVPESPRKVTKAQQAAIYLGWLTTWIGAIGAVAEVIRNFWS